MGKRIIVLGSDGFIGHSLVKYLCEQGDSVLGVDNLIRRSLVSKVGSDSLFPIKNPKEREILLRNLGYDYTYQYGDTAKFYILKRDILRFKPDAIVHLAEIPSAPYSMMGIQEACFVQANNVLGTLNLLFAVKEIDPTIQIVKIGTMGQYQIGNLPISEGWIEVEYKGRKETVPFPKVPGSFYHLSKSMDTLNIEFACRVWGLNCTDINQGVVFGAHITSSIIETDLQTRLDVDSCFPAGIEITCNPKTKFIEEVNVGDNVLTHEGRFKKVTKKFQKEYLGDLISFEMQHKLNNFSVTPNHPLLVVKKDKNRNFQNPCWITAGSIYNWFDSIEKENQMILKRYKQVWDLRSQGISGEKISQMTGINYQTVASWVYKKQKPKKVTKQREKFYFIFPTLQEVKDVSFLETKEFNFWEENKYNKNRELKNPLPDKIEINYDTMKLFGFYLSQGSLSKYQTIFSLNENKIEDIEFIDKVLKKYFNLTSTLYYKKESKCCNIIVHSKAFSSFILKNFGQYAKCKFFPLWSLFLPVEKQKGIIDGVFAGDGYKGNLLEITNKNLCESVKLIFGRMGIHASIYERERENLTLPEERRFNKKSKTFTVFWKKLDEFGRGKGFRKLGNKILVPVKRVSKTNFKGIVYNLEVEEDHSYVANTVAVHNCFGTVSNRLCAQAVIEHPLTVYGTGGQTRGFLPLRDSVKCISLLIDNPCQGYRVVNQLAETYQIRQLADTVKKIAINLGLDAEVKNYENPRFEAEEHFYEVERKILADLGYVPSITLEEEISNVIKALLPYKDRIKSLEHVLVPDVFWSGEKKKAEIL